MKKRKLVLIILSASTLFIGSPAIFADEAVPQVETTGDYFKEIGIKFGRGLENTVTSLAEIPCTIHDDMSKDKGSGFFTGFGRGTVYMLRRILVGVTEVGTFFIPMGRTIPRVCQDSTQAV